LARARGEATHLTHEQIVGLVGVWYRREIEQWTSDPGSEAAWEATLDDLRLNDESGDRIKPVAADVEELLAAEVLKVGDETRAAIAEQLFPYKVRLAQTILRRTRGDYRPDENLTKFPAWKTPGETQEAQGITLTGIVEGWAAERNANERTKYGWERILKNLAKHLGHENATRISRDDVLSWKDAMIQEGLKASTVKNKLTVASTLFGWALENRRIAENPAKSIRLYARKERTKARMPYTSEDARLVLSSARLERKAERRWVPWLLAFTGARLGEVCDATAQDIRKIDGIWCLDINEHNRGREIKNIHSIRTVPLHPAVIAEGFLEYVSSLPEKGPLFPDVPPDRFGQRAGNGTKRVSRWIRSLGLTDTRKDPNHAWRHYVTDQLRNAGVPKDMRDRIIGHRLPDEAEKYGEGFSVSILAEHLNKIASPLNATKRVAA
jgi:integrase